MGSAAPLDAAGGNPQRARDGGPQGRDRRRSGGRRPARRAKARPEGAEAGHAGPESAEGGQSPRGGGGAASDTRAGPRPSYFARAGSEGRSGPEGGGDPERAEARRGPTEPREARARPGARSRGPERTPRTEPAGRVDLSISDGPKPHQNPIKTPSKRDFARGLPGVRRPESIRKTTLYQIDFLTAAA